MPEIGMSVSMSGDGKRGVGHRPQATAPILDSTEADLGGVERSAATPNSSANRLASTLLPVSEPLVIDLLIGSVLTKGE
jgi:hypothetical protein